LSIIIPPSQNGAITSFHQVRTVPLLLLLLVCASRSKELSGCAYFGISTARAIIGKPTLWDAVTSPDVNGNSR